MSRCWRVAVCLVLVSAIAGLGLGQGPEKPPAKSGAKEGDPPGKEPKLPEPLKKVPLEKLKALPNSIFVVVEDLQQALGLHPTMFAMTLARYQELVDEIAFLKGQLKKEKKTPHACKLTGKVEGDVVSLEAQYIFSTEKPNTVVVLGLQGGHLTREGDLDGQVPNLDFGEDGFVVEVESPGRHQLTLRLEAAVLPRKGGLGGGAGERGFDLGLPGAAVTTVALELPGAVQELRWNDQVEKRQRGGRWEFAAPAKLKTLTMSWKEPMTFPGTGPLRSAEGHVSVLIEEAQVVVNGELTLEMLRGLTGEWQLLTPADAEVEAKTAAGLPLDVLRPDKKNTALIRLPQPSADRVHVTVKARYPRSLSRVPIGPLAVIGADYQKGTIAVKASAEALRGIRLVYHRHGEVSQRETSKAPPGAEAVVAAFQYSLPSSGKGLPGKGPRGVPLELEFKAERGQVGTRVEHWLRVRSVAEGYRVDAKTLIKAEELQGPVDYLELQLPRLPVEPLPGLFAVSPVAFPSALPWLPLVGVTHFGSGMVPEPEEPNATGEKKSPYACQGDGRPELLPASLLRRSRIRWTATKGKAFTVELQGSYLLPREPRRVRLELPRPIGTWDRGGGVTTLVGDDNLELLIEDGPSGGESVHSRAWDSAPRFVDLAWRPYQPELSAVAETDVELKEGYARVRQEIRFEFPAGTERPGPAKSREVRFRVPPALQQSLKVGGRAEEKQTITVSAEPGKPVVLEYEVVFPPPEAEAGGRVVEFPLVWPEAVPRIASKVRVWSEPGVAPVLAGPELAGVFWKNQGPEVVPGRSSLPALVLSSASGKPPLRLLLREMQPARKMDLLIERGLIQAVVDDDGHHYRARFLVRKLNTSEVNIEIPAPVPLRDPVVHIGPAQGEKKPLRVPATFEQSALRITLNPELFPDPVYLDVEYHLPREVLDSGPFWNLQLYPPMFKNEVFLKRVVWQVHCPSGTIPLVAGRDMRPEFHWAFRNGLVTPEPTPLADFEDWPGESWSGVPAPLLVFSSSSLQPVRVIQVQWQAWFLACSGVVLLAGLALSFSPLPRPLFWLLLALLVSGAIAGGFLWPMLLPVVLYGIQPGVAVLLCVLGVHWLLQERYRRQLVFMPGFARMKPGSSVVRTGSSSRPREASTVDAPATSGNSQSAGVG